MVVTEEIGMLTTGKHIISGRELSKTEIGVNSALNVLDVIPGATAVRSLNGAVHLADGIAGAKKLDKLKDLGTTVRNQSKLGYQSVDNMIRTAGAESKTRLVSAKNAFADGYGKLKTKIANDAKEVKEWTQQGVNIVKENLRMPLNQERLAGTNGMIMDAGGETSTIKNTMQQFASKFENLNLKKQGTGVKDDYFIGVLKGEKVHLKGVKTKEIVYTKRDPDEAAILRKKFNSSVRKNFLKEFANNPVRVEQLRKAGLSETSIARMKDGLNPKGWQVHHNLPLDDGGTNDFSNLVLIKNDPYHKAITNEQNSLTRELVPKQSITINWPLIEGDIYPPKPF